MAHRLTALDHAPARAHRAAMRFRLIPALALAILAGCAHQPGRKTLAAAAPEFDAARFFDGQTEGVGTLHRVMHRLKQTIVRGTGRYVDGRLILTQRVLIQDEPPSSRTWDLHRVAPGQWRGTVSDAVLPVTMVTSGNALHVRYPTGTGFQVDQWLYLQPDGRTALNRTRITKFGTSFGLIEETIRHLD